MKGRAAYAAASKQQDTCVDNTIRWQNDMECRCRKLSMRYARSLPNTNESYLKFNLIDS